MQYDEAVPELLPAGHAVQLVADPRLNVPGPHTEGTDAWSEGQQGCIRVTVRLGMQECVHWVASAPVHVRLHELLPDCGW